MTSIFARTFLTFCNNFRQQLRASKFKTSPLNVSLSDGVDFFIPGDGRWTISYVAVDCPTLPGRHGKIHLLI